MMRFLEKEFDMDLWSNIGRVLNNKLWMMVPISQTSNAWIAHQRNEKELPWEDAARLEHHLFGHCNDTLHRLYKEGEARIWVMASEKGIDGESMFESIKKLEENTSISHDMARDLNAFRISRNKQIHSLGSIPSLQETLEMISLVRSFGTSKKKKGYWAQPSKTKWAISLDNKSIVKVIEVTLPYLEMFLKNRLEINGDIWFKPILLSYDPGDDKIDNKVLTLLDKLPDADNGLSKDEFKEQMVDKMVENIKFRSNSITKNGLSNKARADINLLEDMGFEGQKKQYYEGLLTALSNPKNIEELTIQKGQLETAGVHYPRGLLENRWRITISSKGFKGEWKHLVKMVSEGDENLSGKLRERLIILTLDPFIKQFNIGEPEKELHRLNDAILMIWDNVDWQTTIQNKDGWMGEMVSQYLNRVNNKGKKEFLSKYIKKDILFLPGTLTKTNIRISEAIEKWKRNGNPAKERGKKK